MNLPQHHVLIGTPAYAGMVHVDFVTSVLKFQSTGISFALMTIANESLITRGRNTILAAFHARREYTHLLFLDGDIHLPAEGLARLIAHEKDVIGVPVALKGRTPEGRRVFNIGPTIGEDGPLLLNQRIGTAVLMLSRRAVDALVEDARAADRVYHDRIHRPGAWEADLFYEVFRTGVVDGEYLSEDFWVCRTLLSLGFDIHVDPLIVTRHQGTIAT